MRRPRLSILAPTYNRAHMIPRFLQSMQSVTSDCEIIVMDNASTDDTQSVVCQYAGGDERIRYVRHPENIGVIANYNAAMEAAQGEMICCMGDDDAVLPGNFERKLALLDSHPQIGLVYSLWNRMDQNGNDLGVCYWPGLLRCSYLGGRSEFLDLLPACYIHLQGVVFRRELFDKYGGADLRPDMTAGQDWDMLLRWISHTETAFIAEPMVSVGIHAQSQTESVCRANGHFAQGRITIWRKWLVENDSPPVLDDSRWQRMADAFLPDLQYEFAGDQGRISGYMESLEAIKRDSRRKVAAIFQKAVCGETGKGQASSRSQSHETGPLVANQPEGQCESLPIVWNAPLRDPSGYADEARHFVFALEGRGVSLAARELRWNDRVALLSTDRERALNRLLANPVCPDAVHVCHILASHFRREPTAAANVGRTMFETDRLPEGWANTCNQMDAVWVPSEFNRKTFEFAGVAKEKLCVIPGAIDLTPYDPNCPPLRIKGARKYNFLSVFDWTLRKGWDVLIRAFIEEFSQDEDVALLFKIHSSAGVTLEQIVRDVETYLIETLGRDPNRIPDIVFQDANIPDSRMPHLYRAADCYVMPSRGEGWGRPYMEAMAMGLPTIATNWSGQTQFMTEENSLLLDCDVVDVPEAGWIETPTYKGHRWAEPSKTHLRHLMRRAFEDRSGCKEIGLRARADIAASYSYDQVAALIIAEAERLRM